MEARVCRWLKLLLVLMVWVLATASAVAWATTIDFSYDELDRLTHVSRSDGPQLAFAYDDASNVTSRTVGNSPDTDGDGLANFVDVDDDNDQLPDAYEIQVGLDPLDPADAASDEDGDGESALTEFQNGTDPNDAASNSRPVTVPVMPLWCVLAIGLSVCLLARRVEPRATSSLIACGLLAGIAFSLEARVTDPATLSLPAISSELRPNPSLPQSPTVSPETNPGWIDASATRVSPDTAKTILGPPVAPGILGPIAIAESAASGSSQGGVGDFSQLATALRNDPLRIYQFVRNHFEYVPYFGALKGPYLTLLERAGNDFDQSAVLVELLRAAGYPANYRYGTIAVQTADTVHFQALANALGAEADLQILADILANGGVPVLLREDGLEFDRVWVEVAIAGQVIALDPAFKPIVRANQVDLGVAAALDRTTLLAAAGGTISADSAQGLDELALAAYLSTTTNHLLDYLAQNHPNARFEDIVGAYRIVEDDAVALPAALPLPATPDYPAFAAIPTNYLHTVRLRHGGIDTTLQTREIAGRKLSLSYAPSSLVIPPAPPGATDFGSVEIGEAGAVLALNPGNPNPVTIQVTATLNGSGAGAFDFLSGGGTRNIPPGGTVAIELQFSGVGQSAGRKDATLNLAYSFQGSSIGSQQVAMTGVVEPEREAFLYLDDMLLVAEGQPTGDRATLRLDVDHPYAANGGGLFDQSVDFAIDREGSYVLISGFGGDRGSELLAQRQRRLAQLQSEGAPDDSREVVSETLNVIGQTWLSQTQLNFEIQHWITGRHAIRHHRFGLAAQESGYYVDVKAQVASRPRRTANPPSGDFEVATFISSGMEHSVLEQLQGAGNPGISTVRLMALNNAAGGKLFRVDATNYTAVRPQLSGYSGTQLDEFESLVNAGYALGLPQSGQVSLNQWSGQGFVTYLVDGTARSLGMAIGGGLMGGFASIPQPVEPEPTRRQARIQATPSANVPRTLAVDPVDLATGAFVSELTDLSVRGAGARGLAFSRSYNSQQSADDPAGLGRGWNHGYNIRVEEHSDVAIALGRRAPADAAPLLVATQAMRLLLAPLQPTAQEWAVSALIADWMTQRLLGQTATVRFGDRALSFQRMPDGRYIPPPGVTSELVKLVDGSFELRQRFGTVHRFNTAGRITSSTDVDGNSLVFGYSGNKLTGIEDAYGRSLVLAYSGDALASVTDSTGRSVSYQQASGDLVGVTGLEGAGWGYTYDALGQLLTVTDPVGAIIVDNAYDASGRVVSQRAPREGAPASYHLHYGGVFSAEEDPLGNRVTYFYDSDRRAIAVEDAVGNVTRADYDGQGQLTLRTDARGNATAFAYDADNNRVAVVDALAQASAYTYDAHHRLTRVTDPLGHFSEFSYDAGNHLVLSRDGESNTTTTSYFSDGLPQVGRNPRGVETTFAYDANGYPALSTTGTQPPVTTVYDGLGRLTSLSDPVGTTTRFSHDPRGLVLSREDGLGHVTSFAYDLLGRVVGQTDRNGAITTTTYTGSGKLKSINRPGEVVTFDYDSRDNLVSMSDGSGTTSNSYDALNRPTGTTDANGNTVGYAYDEAGNLATLTYPDGNTVSYGYDALNRINSVSIDWLGVSAAPGFDAAGRLTSLSHFNGTVTSYSYDDADRLTGIDHSRAGERLASYAYTLDGNGNRTRVQADAAPILPAALINTSLANTFNPQRNRLTTRTIDGSAIAMTYDAEGQLTGRGMDALVFDGAGRLLNDGVHAFSYDALGNRLRANRGGIETHYVYDSNGNLLAETDATGNITRYYIHGVGLMAMVDAQTGAPYVYHFDGSGNTVAMTDASGAIANRYAYSPFGRVPGIDESVPQPFTFVGQYGVMTERDGLYYMRARYYDSTTGRFISEDPVGIDGGLNLYAYAGGNPINYVDPRGDVPLPVVTGIVGGVSGLAGACFDGCSLKEAAIGLGTGAAAGAIGGTGRVVAFARRSASNAVKVGTTLGAGSNAASQVVDITTSKGESLIRDFSVPESALSGLAGNIGGRATVQFGTSTASRIAAGKVDAITQVAVGLAGKALGK